MSSKNLMLFGIFLLAVSQLIGVLGELNEDGALTTWMESVVSHPFFELGFGIFALICVIAMPIIFVRAKKYP